MNNKLYYISFFNDNKKNFAIYEVTNVSELDQSLFPELKLSLKYKSYVKTEGLAKSVFEKLVKQSKFEIILKQYKDGINVFNTNKHFVQICYRYLRRYCPEELL